MGTTLAQYVDALEQTWTGLAEAVTGLSEEQWRAPTELPGWPVKDVVAHIVGIEAYLLGEPYPDHPLPDGLDHVRNDVGRWVEVPVDLRRPLPGEAVLAELRDVTERRLKALRALEEAALGDTVLGLLGAPTKLQHLLGLRVFDSWAHEQDVRRALGRPGGLDNDAARLTRRRIFQALPALPVGAGRSVVFDLSEPASVTTVTFGAGSSDGALEAAEATVATTYESFVRLATGRVRYPDVPVTISGDRAFAEDVLGRLAITP